ncbi:hypothetical protein FOL47_004078 [Perkinsus chesapeaki]|uniref:Uncharacterized protein n=1 Tax=Perkinsus chesapeaki TaxID=330153 RepID=A0A7J6M4P9_PERCH|nr:hypothetical protein FOL47_004078 [Perkinsus chesapeaki]
MARVAPAMGPLYLALVPIAALGSFQRYTNECWNDEFVPEICCEPHKGGNPQCWDDAEHFTFDKCCGKCWSDPLYRPMRCCEGGMSTEGDPRCWFNGRTYFDCCAPDTPGLAAIRKREAGTGGWHWDGDFAWSGDLSFSQSQVSARHPEL